MPSERGAVVSFDAVRPLPATGLPPARSGGQACAQAPVHALLVPLSAWNRYRVRPWESTRIFPRPPLLATPTVAVWPPDVVGGVAAVAPPPPPPPQPATTRAARGTAAAVVRNGVGLRRGMVAPLLWGVEVRAARAGG